MARWIFNEILGHQLSEYLTPWRNTNIHSTTKLSLWALRLRHWTGAKLWIHRIAKALDSKHANQSSPVEMSSRKKPAWYRAPALISVTS